MHTAVAALRVSVSRRATFIWHHWPARTVLVALFLAAVGFGFAAARPVDGKPVVPCGERPYPSYPAPEAPPKVILWTSEELDKGWSPPACAAWQSAAATNVVALAGYLQNDHDAEEILSRIGSISSLRDVRYWSVTDKQWNTMFARAIALTYPAINRPRGDFSVAELKAGGDFYFLAADNRSREDVVWRLHIANFEVDRIILQTTNVTPLHWLFVPFVQAGDFQTSYFLERNSGGFWQLYSLTRVLYASSFFVHFVPDASYINRTVALYRHFAGISTDRDPPTAP